MAQASLTQRVPQVGALPPELLLHVLSLLPSEALCYGGAVRGVCRRWRHVSESPPLWRRRHAECRFW